MGEKSQSSSCRRRASSTEGGTHLRHDDRVDNSADCNARKNKARQSQLSFGRGEPKFGEGGEARELTIVDATSEHDSLCTKTSRSHLSDEAVGYGTDCEGEQKRASKE
jgi:hypothetical protein